MPAMAFFVPATACTTVLGPVMRHAPGGDWKRVDWDRLAQWIRRYGYKITECEAEELPTKEATCRLRAWEKRSSNE